MTTIELSLCGDQDHPHLPAMLRTSVEDTELSRVICDLHYSPFVFEDDQRSKGNFRSTDLFVMDVDDGWTLDEATELFQPHKHIIATSRNHQKVKNAGTASEKPACDRFRVILFLSAPITDEATYAATWRWMHGFYPAIDPAAKDTARFYFKCQEVVSEQMEGGLIDPCFATASVAPRLGDAVQRQPELPETEEVGTTPGGELGRLSVVTMKFMKHGVGPGEFNAALYKAAKDYQQQGYTKQEFVEAWNGAHPDPKGALHPLNSVDKATVASAFKTAPKHPARAAGGSDVNDDHPEVLTHAWLKANGVTSICGRGYRLKGEECPADVLSDRCYFDIMKSKKSIRPGDVVKALNLWKREANKVYIEGIAASLGYDPEVEGPWEELTHLVKGHADPLSTALFQHLVWQVKRKLNHLPVRDHMMPVVYGKQGSGKTSLVEKLAEPLRELFCKPQSLQVLSDAREATIFRDNALIFFDEMAQAARADVESIKNKITAKEVTFRVLGTNDHVTYSNGNRSAPNSIGEALGGNERGRREAA